MNQGNNDGQDPGNGDGRDVPWWDDMNSNIPTYIDENGNRQPRLSPTAYPDPNIPTSFGSAQYSRFDGTNAFGRNAFGGNTSRAARTRYSGYPASAYTPYTPSTVYYGDIGLCSTAPQDDILPGVRPPDHELFLPNPDRPYGQPTYDENGSLNWPQEWRDFLMAHPYQTGDLINLVLGGQDMDLPHIFLITPTDWVLQSSAALHDFMTLEERTAWTRQYLGVDLSEAWSTFFANDMARMDRASWLGIVNDIANGVEPDRWINIFAPPETNQPGGDPATVPQNQPPGPRPRRNPRKRKDPPDTEEGQVKRPRVLKRFKGDLQDHPEWWGKYADDGPIRPDEPAEGYHRRLHRARFNMQIQRRIPPGLEETYRYDSKDVFDARRRQIAQEMINHTQRLVTDPDYKASWDNTQRTRREQNAQRRKDAFEYKRQWQLDNGWAADEQQPDPPDDSDHDELYDPGFGVNLQRGVPYTTVVAPPRSIAPADDEDEQADTERQWEPYKCHRCGELKIECDNKTKRFPCGPCIAAGEAHLCRAMKGQREIKAAILRMTKADAESVARTGRRRRTRVDTDEFSFIPSYYLALLGARTIQAPNFRVGIVPMRREATKRTRQTTQEALRNIPQDNIDSLITEVTAIAMRSQPQQQIGQGASGSNQTGTQATPALPMEPCANCKGGWRAPYCGNERPCAPCVERGEECIQGHQYQIVQDDIVTQRQHQHQIQTGHNQQPQIQQPQPPEFFSNMDQDMILDGIITGGNSATQLLSSPIVAVPRRVLDPTGGALLNTLSGQQLSGPPATIGGQQFGATVPDIQGAQQLGASPPNTLWGQQLGILLPDSLWGQPLNANLPDTLWGQPLGTTLPENTGVLAAQRQIRNQVQQPQSPTTELQNAAVASMAPRVVNQYNQPDGNDQPIQYLDANGQPLQFNDHDINWDDWINDDGQSNFQSNRWINQYNNFLEGRHSPVGSDVSMDSGSSASSNQLMDSPPDVFNGTQVNAPTWAVPNVPPGYDNIDDGLDPDKRCKEIAGFNFWNDVPHSVGVGLPGREGAWVDAAMGTPGASGVAFGRHSQRILNRLLCGTRYTIGINDEANRLMQRDPAKHCDHALDNDMASCKSCNTDQHARMRNFQNEDRTVRSTKHFFCDTCNQKLQTMRANVNGVPGLRIGICDCVAQLRKTWLCNAHRVATKVAIQVRAHHDEEHWNNSRERYTCPGCKIEQEGDGSNGAWRCRSCHATVTMP